LKPIGVLALQGDYEKHLNTLVRAEIPAIDIRYPDQLLEIKGLIIPGGESTTMNDLMKRVDFHTHIADFAKTKTVMGTCAGLILMSKKVKNDDQINPLGILDIEVTRNAYGRQLNSFVDTVEVEIDNDHSQQEVAFIRAPKISTVGKSTTILGKHNNDIVAVKTGIHYGFTFHSELNENEYFHKCIFSDNIDFQKENNAA